ncbi:MAG: hypothetical protein ABSG68_10115 [Thermoguttaceae bacterium]|jgi:hypothetical protein
MGWLLFIAAILALVFPPLAIVLLALIVLGVFAKGMDAADSEDPGASAAGKMRPSDVETLDEVVRGQVRQQPRGQVIDVRSYPIPPPPKLVE